MTDRVRPYLFYDVAISICATCYRRVDAKIVFQDGCVYLLKHCPAHGAERVLVADDIDYYRRCREVFIKTPEMPLRYNTPVKWGCPYDCGLCTDHEQHSCLSLVEICDACNLRCPICYSESGPDRQQYRSLEQIARMLDAVVRNEGQPDVVQISGGEPTIHPRFFEVLDLAKARPIRHLMLNTNGVKIAENEAFTARLAGYMPDFEVYLQFDSFEADALKDLRGADLRSVRERALERLNRHGISTTLVVTLKKGVNDHEIGRIVDFALQQPCVRGVTFQPVQAAGRLGGYDPATDRLTLTEVRRRILEQTGVFKPEDIIPVPCHPDALAMAYALKLDGRVTALTGLVDPQILIDGGRNTIIYEQDDRVREGLVQLFATNHSPASGAASLNDLLCCLPRVAAVDGLGYENVFRVIIMEFIDAHAFDVRSVKKSCVHIVHPDDGRLIPFDTYNMFYRDDLERTRLAPLREARRMKRVRYVLSMTMACIAIAMAGLESSPAETLSPVTPLESPAGPGSGQPSMTVSPDGRLYLSWLESGDGKLYRFRVAERTADGWLDSQTIIESDKFFVNWADVPSVLAMRDGRLAAHWLFRDGVGRYAYHVGIRISDPARKAWSETIVPHRDSSPTEHGFVSLFEWPDAAGLKGSPALRTKGASAPALGAIWLDGRAMGSHDKPGGDMSVRATRIGVDGTLDAELVVDGRACECCPTATAVTSDGVVAAYRDRSEGEVRDIAVARLANGKWTAPSVLHADNWQIGGCPVNGPALAADGRRLVAAWFSAEGNNARVMAKFSRDGGRTFGAAVRVNDGVALGRIGAILLPDGATLVTWIEYAGTEAGASQKPTGTEAGATAKLLARIVRADGTREEAVLVTPMSQDRSSGYPRVARRGNEILFAWTRPAARGAAASPARLQMARATLMKPSR